MLKHQFELQGGLCGGPEWQEREAVAFAPRLQAAGYQVERVTDENGDGDPRFPAVRYQVKNGVEGLLQVFKQPDTRW